VSELIVLAFTDRYRAPEVLNELRRNEGPWTEILERAVVVTLDAEGKASVQMNIDLSRREAVAWARVWGALLKAILFVPITDGMAEAADKLACPSVQVGCSPEAEGDECNEIKWWRESLKQSQNFRRDVAALVSPNSSAVLMLVRNIKLSDALQNLEKYANTIVHTTISATQDEQLSKMLTQTL
jgi:uncharacterized membrane protein